LSYHLDPCLHRLSTLVDLPLLSAKLHELALSLDRFVALHPRVLEVLAHRLRRWPPEVNLWDLLDALALIRAPIDALRRSLLLQRRVRVHLPRLTHLLHPVSARELLDLRRATLLRLGLVRALEKLLSTPLHAIVFALAQHQVSMWVAPPSFMNCQRVRQTVLPRHILRELTRQTDLLLLVELTRQRELDLTVHTPVRSLVLVRR
jgi:hypothetical protein